MSPWDTPSWVDNTVEHDQREEHPSCHRTPSGAGPLRIEDEPSTEIPAPAPIPLDPVAAAVVALTVNVEKLRTSLKWGAGLIFVALLFLVGK